ncbi:MAG TPA: translocation/assembly module TamB domain-containing protein [bacterium]|jgi:hypothetical protein|nr:translocation/assembly module TamB domain-containing protein [bacterium]
MRRGGWFALLGLAVLPCVAWALLRFGFVTPLFNLALDRALAGRTTLRVRADAFRWNLLHSVDVDGLIVLAPVEGAMIPLLTLDHLSVDYDLRPALRDRMGWRNALRLVRLRGLKLFLLRGPGGGWNVKALRSLEPPPAPPAGPAPGKAALPAMLPPFRVEVDDSEVVLNDEPRQFNTTIDDIQGWLDTRDLPTMAFAVSGRTGGQRRKNLALAGAWNQALDSVDGRLNLRSVPLSSYLNYFLPVQGLRFTRGMASLSVHLLRKKGQEMDASGRAEVAQGALTLPGISQPVSGVSGEVAFDPRSLRFKGARAHFLGSDWGASGSILDLKHPRFDVQVRNPAVPLSALSQQVRGLDLLRLSGTASVSAALSGPAYAPQVKAFMQAPWLELAGFEMESVSVTAALEGTRLSVGKISGTLWGGELDGSGAMGLQKGGALNADLSLNGALLQLARLHGHVMLPFDGLTRAHVVVSGPWRSPDAKFDLDVDRLRLRYLELGNLRARALLSKKGLQGSFFTDQGQILGTVAIAPGQGKAPPYFHDSSATVKQLDLGILAMSLASLGSAGGDSPVPGPGPRALRRRLAGSLDAQFTAEGPMASPTFWMRARLSQGRVFALAPGSKGAPQAQSLDLRTNGLLGWHKNDILLGRALEPLRIFLGPRNKGLEIQALGRYPLSGPGPQGHVALALDADLGLLDSLPWFKRSSGTLSGDLVLSGGLAAPQLLGNISVSNFSSEPVAYLAPLRAGSMKLVFKGQGVQLAALSFRAPGLVSAAGGLDLAGGPRGLRGTVQVTTDATGLRLQNWDSMGTGNLVLAPLDLELDGEDEPLSVRGRVVLSQARIVFAGSKASPDDSGSGAPPEFFGHPLYLDMGVGLGGNVQYEKLQVNTVDFRDPRKWFSGVLQTAEESLLQPGVSFRMAPTQQDFLVQGTVPDLHLQGELEVARGRISILSNDFNIGGGQGPTYVRFEGRHADISGTAQARFNYTRYINGRETQKTVEVYAYISPRTQDEMDAVGLGKQFLNYQISFDSDPQIIDDDPAQQQTAVLNLVLLGDPLVDVDDTGSVTPIGGSETDDPDEGALLASAGIGAATSGLLRQIMNAGLGNIGILGNNWLDVVRVSPSIRYQLVGAAPIQAAGGAEAVPLASASTNSSYDIDWAMEFGKYIAEKVYASLQVLTFGENSRDSVILANQSNQVVQSYGVRAGAEYQLSATRSLDVYGDFGCDDYLNPVAYNANLDAPPPSYLVQWRNTIPTDNYSTQLARQRRWEATEGDLP